MKIEQIPRILHVAQPPDGGAIVCASNLVADQRARGWDVAIASEAKLLAQTAASSNAKFYHWSAERQPGMTVIRECRHLAQILREFRPTVVHLHSAKAGLCGRLVVRGRLPTLYQPHGWSFYAATGLLQLASSWWERGAARWSSVTLYVSDDERRAGERVGVRSRWAVIPNGIDADYWRPPSASDRAAARAQLGVAAPAHVVVCVARLQRAKGVDVLVSAWPCILRNHPNARLVIVGDGPDRTQLSARALRQVTFAGTRDPMPFLAAADVFVAPSRWEAGASLAVLEAMACGLPVVATNVNGMSGFLERQSLAPVDSAGALAAMVSALLDSAEERRRLGTRNRETINAHGSLARSTARTSALTLHAATR